VSFSDPFLIPEPAPGSTPLAPHNGESCWLYSNPEFTSSPYLISISYWQQESIYTDIVLGFTSLIILGEAMPVPVASGSLWIKLMLLGILLLS